MKTPDPLRYDATVQEQRGVPPEDFMTAKAKSMSSMNLSSAVKAALLRLPSPFCPARCCYQSSCLQYPRLHPCPPRWARRFNPQRLIALMDVPSAVQYMFTSPVHPGALTTTAAYLEALEQLVKELVQMTVPFTYKRLLMQAPDTEPERRREARRRANLIKVIVNDNRKFLIYCRTIQQTPRMSKLQYKEHPLFECAPTSVLLNVAQGYRETYRELKKNAIVYPANPAQNFDF